MIRIMNDMKTKITFFKDSGKKAHIEKYNREFLNGVILDSDDVVIKLKEDRRGVMEVFITDIHLLDFYYKK